MRETEFVFTSESVAEGHPDKVADQISDAILDAILIQDEYARVACETLIKSGIVFIAGEMTTTASIDFEQIAKQVIYDIGYTHADLGFDVNTCTIMTSINTQSPDIAQGITKDEQMAQGAGDQGMMFGYACDETHVWMPAPIYYAQRLMQRQAYLRKSGQFAWLGPDAKTQVTFRYQNDQPIAIPTLIFSTQHDPDIKQDQVHEAVIEDIIKPTIPAAFLLQTQFLINPTGRFVIGGPQGDCGLTGRKLMVDSYGGFARHGGGCFSGKDPSKVDRSAAYAARYVAKNIVAAGLAKRCEIQLAYAIGMADPIAIYLSTFGTGSVADKVLTQFINEQFNLRPFGIINKLDLLRPIYQATACYGHFGREDLDLSWESLDQVTALRALKGDTT